MFFTFSRYEYRICSACSAFGFSDSWRSFSVVNTCRPATIALVLATAGIMFPAIFLTARREPAGIWKEKQRRCVKETDCNKEKQRYVRGCRDNRDVPAAILIKRPERRRISLQKVPPNPGSQDVDGGFHVPHGFEIRALLEVMVVSNAVSILSLTSL